MREEISGNSTLDLTRPELGEDSFRDKNLVKQGSEEEIQRGNQYSIRHEKRINKEIFWSGWPAVLS